MLNLEQEPYRLRESLLACRIGSYAGAAAALIFGVIWLSTGRQSMATLGAFELLVALLFHGWARRYRHQLQALERSDT
ncbi:MAG: hypothetical protein NDJ72_05200 [Elusimicrobia bacterium]|nr:hypothetical protein [Elusimicrobiota bacterium]